MDSSDKAMVIVLGIIVAGIVIVMVTGMFLGLIIF